MKYIYILFLLIIYKYSLSYAKYAWDRKQYLPCIGTIFLVIIAFILPVVVLLTE